MYARTEKETPMAFTAGPIPILGRKLRNPNWRTNQRYSAMPNSYGPAIEVQGMGKIGILNRLGLTQGIHDSLSPRFELREAFGQDGIPGLSADITSATEATREPVNRNWEVAGANMTSALATYNAGGGLRLTTATADNDQAWVIPHDDTKQTAWRQTAWTTDSSLVCQWYIGIKDIVKSIVWCGLKLTATDVIATDDDQCYFRFKATESANWQYITSRAGVDVTAVGGAAAGGSAVPVVDERILHMMIVINAARVPHFFINARLVYVGAALVTAISLLPVCGVGASGVTPGAKALNAYGVSLSRNYGL